MAISSSTPEKVVSKVSAEKLPVVAVIYDSSVEPKSKRLGSRAGIQTKRAVIRPSITLMGMPRSADNSVEGMAKFCPLLTLRVGATILSDRTLWEEVKQQPHVIKLLADGQFTEVEATYDEGATFASFTVEDTEILLVNLYNEDHIEPYLELEQRKEVFRMAEERKAECIRHRDATK